MQFFFSMNASKYRWICDIFFSIFVFFFSKDRWIRTMLCMYAWHIHICTRLYTHLYILSRRIAHPFALCLNVYVCMCMCMCMCVFFQGESRCLSAARSSSCTVSVSSCRTSSRPTFCSTNTTCLFWRTSVIILLAFSLF
jgi:hypothetical protein